MIAQLQEQLIRDSTSVTGLTIHETYLLIGIGSLALALVYMFYELRKTHNRYFKSSNDNIERMTTAMTNSTNAMENNNKIVERLLDKFDGNGGRRK